MSTRWQIRVVSPTQKKFLVVVDKNEAVSTLQDEIKSIYCSSYPLELPLDSFSLRNSSQELDPEAVVEDILRQGEVVFIVVSEKSDDGKKNSAERDTKVKAQKKPKKTVKIVEQTSDGTEANEPSVIPNKKGKSKRTKDTTDVTTTNATTTPNTATTLTPQVSSAEAKKARAVEKEQPQKQKVAKTTNEEEKKEVEQKVEAPTQTQKRKRLQTSNEETENDENSENSSTPKKEERVVVKNGKMEAPAVGKTKVTSEGKQAVITEGTPVKKRPDSDEGTPVKKVKLADTTAAPRPSGLSALAKLTPNRPTPMQIPFAIPATSSPFSTSFANLAKHSLPFGSFSMNSSFPTSPLPSSPLATAKLFPKSNTTKNQVN